MPTIHDLPLETIGRIITIAHPAGSFEYREDECEARRAFLRACCLVCRDWKPFAQAELWTVVDFRTFSAIERFAFAGPGRHPVKTLSLGGAGGGRNPPLDSLTETILCDVRGVHELYLSYCRIRPSWLCGSGFRDLKVLKLTQVAQAIHTTTAPFPFHLNELHIASSLRGPLPSLLLALSQQSSIRVLNIVQESLAPLLPLAPRLTTLETAIVDSLEDFLPNCIRLENLIVTGRCLSEVEHLPSSLVTLEIDMEWEMEFVPLLLDLLEPSKVMAAKALEELHLISLEYSLSPGRGPQGVRYKVETGEVE